MATKLTTLEPFFPFFLALGESENSLEGCRATHCWCFQFALLWVALNGIKSGDKLNFVVKRKMNQNLLGLNDACSQAQAAFLAA